MLLLVVEKTFDGKFLLGIKSITYSTVKLQVGVSFYGAVSQVVLEYQFYDYFCNWFGTL